MASRRKVLKMGLLAGGSCLAGANAARGQLCSPDGIPPDLLVRPSPNTTPFVVALPIPPVAVPILESELDPPPDPARHQRYGEFRPVKFYEIHQREFLHSYHPEMPPAVTWGYNGMAPGPTFHARYGEPIFVRMFNDLPADHVGFGLPSTTTHLHNLHTATESDGFPLDFIDPGKFHDHHYPLFPAGSDDREKLTSLWYHDHRMDFTAPNVYAGLTGFFLIFDDEDSGDENDTNPAAWRLPSGKYDVPLMLHDVLFDANGQAVFDIFNTDGILGDKWTINRVIQPFFEVEPRKYRFRIQNGGPSRFYELFLSSGQPFVVISNDGNILPAPIEAASLKLSVAQRHDVVIDFSRHQPGDQVFLENRLEQLDGRGPTGRILDPGDQMMRFDVVEPTGPDNSRVPEVLRALPPIDLSEVAKERMWTFDYDGGLWTVNGQPADMRVINAAVKQGTAEIWTLRNEGSDWSHPIHIHFEEFQILEFNRRPIAPGDVRFSRKDVVTLGPFDEVKLFIRFRDFLGRYIMHCHNVVHEDHAMMIRWDIVEA
ncbi:MAG: multicopper oxidase family protein [Phycisphaerae bacterium]